MSEFEALGKRMVSFIDVDADSFVVELGAGTGVVTESILQRGIAPNRLVVIEKAASLAKHLSQRFLEGRVLHTAPPA